MPAARPRHRTAWGLGAAVSFVVHALLLFWYGGIGGPPGFVVTPGGQGPVDLEGMELLNLAETAEAEESEESPDEPVEVVVPEPEPEREEVSPVPARPDPSPETSGAGTGDGEGFGPDGPTAAERLRVRTSDGRLWAPLTDEVTGLSAQQLMESELAWRLGVWNDSMAMEADRAERATDWTYTDEEGNRWGVSPGRIHLGSITLPMPFSFGVAPGVYDEVRERAFIDGEIARGAATSVIRDSWRDRAQAIRRRRDRERAEAQEEARTQERSGAGPRRTRPDTTRVPRIR